MGKPERINGNDYLIKLKKSMSMSDGRKKHPASWYADRSVRTEQIADSLVKMFDAPQSRNFFLKCAWHLSEYQIDKAIRVSRAPSVSSPVKYFVRVCNNEMLRKR